MAFHKKLWKKTKKRIEARFNPRGDVYIHKYKGGYDEYMAAQILANKKKLHKVWADVHTLEGIATDIDETNVKTGMCHGARNGFEVEWFRERLAADVVGSDISETATQFPNMTVWDFHDVNPDWVGRFDFIYTNSLDQAMDPQKALKAWAGQLSPIGRIYIEHTEGHRPQRAGAMDPFGAEVHVMPDLINRFGGDDFEYEKTLTPGAKDNNGYEAFVFVVKAK